MQAHCCVYDIHGAAPLPASAATESSLSTPGLFRGIVVSRELVGCHCKDLNTLTGCRSGQGRPSGLLKGHPAKLLKSSRVKPSGAVFDRTKLRDMYKSEMLCATLIT